jgi:hypothetical protein
MVSAATAMAIAQQDIIVIVRLFIATCTAHDVFCSELLVLVIMLLWNLSVPLNFLALEDALLHPLHTSMQPCMDASAQM